MRWIAYILLIASSAVQAQVVTVRADTTALRIGEHVTLTLEVQWDPQQAVPDVEWPVVGDTLSSPLEVIAVTDQDTMQGPDALMRIVRRVKITSFDTGYWPIAPFAFTVNGRPLETEALLLEVRPTQLDEGGALRDIRDIHEVPFSFLHWLGNNSPWLLGFLVLLALALLIALAIRKRRQRGPATEKEAPPLPLHERVIAELRGVEAQKLWQSGEDKTYQARVTDLVRGYIEERYSVPALERTTDELLRELRLSSMELEQRNRLANMLKLADLVKFAKGIPSNLENERLMIEAIRFVQDTAAKNGHDVRSAARHGNSEERPITPSEHAN